MRVTRGYVPGRTCPPGGVVGRRYRELCARFLAAGQPWGQYLCVAPGYRPAWLPVIVFGLSRWRLGAAGWPMGLLLPAGPFVSPAMIGCAPSRNKQRRQPLAKRGPESGTCLLLSVWCWGSPKQNQGRSQGSCTFPWGLFPVLPIIPAAQCMSSIQSLQNLSIYRSTEDRTDGVSSTEKPLRTPLTRQ